MSEKRFSDILIAEIKIYLQCGRRQKKKREHKFRGTNSNADIIEQFILKCISPFYVPHMKIALRNAFK